MPVGRSHRTNTNEGTRAFLEWSIREGSPRVVEGNGTRLRQVGGFPEWDSPMAALDTDPIVQCACAARLCAREERQLVRTGRPTRSALALTGICPRILQRVSRNTDRQN